MCLGFNASAQIHRCKTIPLNQEVVLDSIPFHPGSIKLDSALYEISFQESLKKVKVKGKGDSVSLCYDVFPEPFQTPYRRKELGAYDSVHIIRRNPLLSRNEVRQELFSSPGINKTGSLSRGISVGNAQNVFVNSALNLQLQGQLSKDVSLEAVISDQRVPFQPDGNTQQIQEFDRVYVTLKSPKTVITAGDLVLKNEPGYYLNFQRNLQGGRIGHNWQTSKDSSRTVLSAALSKGKFGTNSLVAREGIQGPYKLTGPNGERFILILSNSERVYVDGKRMKRGWDFDYVIDYNRAEITFTSNVVITQFSRLRVDFEYADRNYTRATTFVHHTQKQKNLEISGSFYQEKDNRNNPLSIELSNDDKLQLSEIGDNLEAAFISALDSVDFDPDLVLYTADTVLIGGVATAVYEHATEGTGPFFQLNFTEVAAGNGDYVRGDLLTNGQVFEWVGPGSGNFVTGRLVITPKQKRMMVGNATYSTKRMKVYGEVAVSEEDQNLFSNDGDGDNQGVATRVGVTADFPRITRSRGGKLVSEVYYDFNQAEFSSIDRFRYIEFDRDWGANSNVQGSNHLIGTSLSWRKDKGKEVTLEASFRDKANDVQGMQGKGKVLWNFTNFGFKVSGLGLAVENLTEATTASWVRVNSEIFARKGKLQPFVNFQMDHNQVLSNTGEVVRTAMFYESYGAGVRTKKGTKVSWQGDYSFRQDKDTTGGILTPRTTAHTANSKVNMDLRKQKITLISTLRDVYNHVQESRTTNLMGRLDWKGVIGPRLITTDLTYAALNGRELKREFLFLEVPFGEGTHIHVDENEDGIQQLDEFVEDPLAGNYIRAFVPTDEFVDAFENSLRLNLNAQFPRKWRTGKSKLKKLGARFSLLGNVVLNQRVTENDLNARFNPFSIPVQESLLSRNASLRSTLFFNRGRPIWGGDLTYAQRARKQLLSAGFDSTGVEEWKVNLRWNLNQYWTLKVKGIQSVRGSSSDLLTRNNYEIASVELEPELAFQPSRVFRLGVNGGWRERDNTLGTEIVQFRELGGTLRWSTVQQRSLTLSATFVDVTHNQSEGFSGTVVGYTMLEGLSSGANWKWQADIKQQLMNGLQLSLSYQARKPQDRATIHVGRIQITALF